MSSYVTLRCGIQMPRVGLGTWQLKGPKCKDSVRTALAAGYELIDTASSYKNEQDIGEILSEYSNARQHSLDTANKKGVFITSKAAPAEMGLEETYAACLKTLANLKQDCIDLYLLHWPGCSGTDPNSSKHRKCRLEAWRAMERLYKEKKVRAIGVSNFLPQHLQELMADGAEIMPHVDQLEVHPLCPNTQLREFAKKEGIVVQAYSSLGNGQILSDKKLVDVAANEGRSCSQVLLKWAIQNDICVIPKSTKKAHLEENLGVVSSPDLSPETMKVLNNLLDDETAVHTCWDPRTIA